MNPHRRRIKPAWRIGNHPCGQPTNREQSPLHTMTKKDEQLGSMDIPLDRPSRVRSLVTYILVVAAVAGLFTWLLAKFTGSGVIALSLSLGMLIYMLVAAGWANRSLGGPDK
jgi:hypothetical protein